MTTTVKIEAHCASNKEVEVTLITGTASLEVFKVQDGEKVERYVYDARYITVREIEKENK